MLIFYLYQYIFRIDKDKKDPRRTLSGGIYVQPLFYFGPKHIDLLYEQGCRWGKQVIFLPHQYAVSHPARLQRNKAHVLRAFQRVHACYKAHSTVLLHHGERDGAVLRVQIGLALVKGQKYNAGNAGK